MNYVRRIAELFLELNPEIPFLDPNEYQLIAEWEKQEIPLHIVIDAIHRLYGQEHAAGYVGFSHIGSEVRNDYVVWLSNSRGPATTEAAR